MNSISEVKTIVSNNQARTRALLQGGTRCSVALFTLVCCSTGCGFVTSQVNPDGPDGSPRASKAPLAAIEVAVERPVFRSRAPQQLAAEAARALPKPEFGITPEVQRELDRFMTRERGTVVQVLARRHEQLGMLTEVFEGEGVPTELLSVAAIESRFDPDAKSPAGALGMWQLMRSTAQIYGLKVSGKLDERLDPIRSSIAAARHLRDLFNSYKDWHLALAAYNAGIGRINRALKSAGETDFWTLARSGSLSGETTRFVPKVIALTMIVADPEGYGFETPVIG